MTLESILNEAADARTGSEISFFRDSGLPVYILTVRILVLERKNLGPIEEAVLRAIHAGLHSSEEILLFLGLPAIAITPILADLNRNELINYSSSTQKQARVTLSNKGREALRESGMIRPTERTVKICLDALTRKLLLISPEQLYRPREMQDLGLYEITHCNAKRPEVDDIPPDEFDRFLHRNQSFSGGRIELLGIRRIERREIRYLQCVTIFYRNIAKRNEIDVSFWRENGPCVAEEVAFRALGGPELIGASLLAKEPPSLPEEPSLQNEQAESTLQPTTNPTLKTILCHEHPKILKDALQNARKRLLIISPWIRHQVVNREFLSLLEAALNRKVQVYIGYGIDKESPKNSHEKPAITNQAKADLDRLSSRYKNFHFVYVGNTHRKSLVCDDTFSVTTSFNWLSFKGDIGKPRDERGQLIQKKHYVDLHFEEDLKLLKEGYHGAQRQL